MGGFGQQAAKRTVGAGFTLKGEGNGNRVAGLYWQTSRRLGVGEWYMTNGETAMHEVGHALDHAYSQASSSDEFATLDRRVQGRVGRNLDAHYHPDKNASGPDAARKERFAELFAHHKMGIPYYLGGGSMGRIDGQLATDLDAYFDGLHAAREVYTRPPSSAYRSAAAPGDGDHLCVAVAGEDGTVTYQQPAPEPEGEPPAQAAAGHADGLHAYWARGKGAALIRWGEGGDFDRCVTHLGKYVADPQGYCAKMHHDVLGFWPATHKKMTEGAAMAMAHGQPEACQAVARHITGDPNAEVEHLGGDRYKVAGKTYKVTFVRDGAALTYEEIPEPAKAAAVAVVVTGRYNPAERRDKGGQWTSGGSIKEAIGRMQPGDRAVHNGITVEKPASPAHHFHVTIGRETRVYTTVAETHRAVFKGQHDRKISTIRTRFSPHAAAPEPGVQVPALATIPGVDILAAGTWQLSTGRQTFTRDDLAHAIDAARCPAVGPPIIKIGHLDKRFALKAEQDGEPALGRVTNLRLAADGHKLQGDLAGMPGWLGVVAASALPRRSVEGKYRFTCQIGHVHPFVLTALALLGVTPPGVGVLGGLDDIARLYGVTAAGGEPWATAPTDQTEGGPFVAVTEEDVRRAYYANAGAPPSWWITELQMAPTQLIISDEDTGKTYRVPFTISGSAVAFGQPDELASYEDVAAARGSGTVVAYASAADSRAVVVAAWDAAAQVANLGDDPSKGAIRALFALPGGTKTDSSLPHHSVSASDHKVGGPDLAGCQAAIGAINGARGGLKGVGPDKLHAAYTHLAKHVRDLGGEPAEFKADAAGQGDGGDPPALEFDAAGNHGSHSGEHSHPHAAYGAQGDDDTHDHMHRHDGDGVHQHAHDPVSAAPPGGGQPTGGGSDMEFTEDQMAAIRAKLGKKDGEDITPEEIAAAFAAPAAPVAASAPEIGDGTYLVDAEILRGYQQRALAGDHAVTQLRTNERDQFIAAAVGAGKFSQARTEHYTRKWDSDPDGTRREIEALAAGLVPVGQGPTGKMGFDPDLGGDFEGQAAYRQLYPDDLDGHGVSAAPGVQGGRR